MADIALAYDLDGPPGAPVVVLAGSLGTDRDMWLPHLPELTTRVRVLRIDHRGHGRSPVPAGPYTIDELGGDVLRLLDRLGLARVGYCGLSLGGMVGMWLAAAVPERVDRLALLCTAAHLPPAQSWLDRAARVRAEGTGGIAEAVLARWFTPVFLRERAADVVRYRAMLSGTPPEGYAGCCEAIAAMDLRGRLPAIAAPTLVVAGAEDPATPPPFAREITALVPAARLEIIQSAAHLAAVEQAGPVGKLLIDHLT